MALTKSGLQALPTAAQDLLALKDYTDRLRARVAYRDAEDPVPIAESVQDVAARAGTAPQSGSLESKGSALNVLVDDYFGVSALMLR